MKFHLEQEQFWLLLKIPTIFRGECVHYLKYKKLCFNSHDPDDAHCALLESSAVHTQDLVLAKDLAAVAEDDHAHPATVRPSIRHLGHGLDLLPHLGVSEVVVYLQVPVSDAQLRERHFELVTVPLHRKNTFLL